MKNVTGKSKNRRVHISFENGSVDDKDEIIIFLQSKRLDNNRKIVYQKMALTFKSFLLLKESINAFVSDDANFKILVEQLNLKNNGIE